MVEREDEIAATGKVAGLVEASVKQRKNIRTDHPDIIDGEVEDKKMERNIKIGFARGGAAGIGAMLLGGGVGAGVGSVVGGIIGSVVPGPGTAFGILVGSGIGAAIGGSGAGGIGFLAGFFKKQNKQ